MTVLLREVVDVLERLYPSSTAQSWDQVGLVTGDPDQAVERVLLALDPTLAVIEEARDLQADLLLTHHPLLLRGVHSVATTTAKGASITQLVVGDIALYVAHTNADVAAEGVCEALARAAGWHVSGGTALFRLYHTPDAAAAQARLARAHIWSRIFPWHPNWLRLGLPGNEVEWARLAAALDAAI